MLQCFEDILSQNGHPNFPSSNFKGHGIWNLQIRNFTQLNQEILMLLYYEISKSIEIFFQMNSSKMSVHATTLIEAFATKFANVRLFSSVGQNVNFHV